MQRQEGVSMWDAVYRMSQIIVNDTTKEKMELLRYSPVTGLDGHEGPSWSTILSMRTIRLGGGRQCFKTTWVASLMAREPDSLLVTIDKDMKNYFIEGHVPFALRNEYAKRVFTIRDLMALMHHREEWALSKLRNCSKLIFDDASFNYMIKNDKFVSGISGQLNESVTVVMVG